MKGNRTAWAGIAACLALALVGSAQATAVIRGGGEGSTLRIAMSDGALRLDSSTLPAGRTLVRVTTTGHRAHALILARLHSGVTAARFARALHTKDGQAALALAELGTLIPGLFAIGPVAGDIAQHLAGLLKLAQFYGLHGPGKRLIEWFCHGFLLVSVRYCTTLAGSEL